MHPKTESVKKDHNQQLPRILIVDDSEEIHRDFTHTLVSNFESYSELYSLESELFGPSPTSTPHLDAPSYEIVHAYSAEEAIKVVQQQQQNPFRIVYMDMRMPPGMDGLSGLQHIWQIDPHVQSVICSAYSDTPWQMVFDMLGNTDKLLLLKKPFDPLEVRQMTASLIAKSIAEQAARMQMQKLDMLVCQRTKSLEEEILRRKELEEKLRRKQHQLQQTLAHAQAASAAKSTFISNISHEVRTPLSVASGYAEVLRDTPLSSLQAESVQAIDSSVQKLDQLFSDILLLSELDQGTTSLNYSSVQLLGFFNAIVQQIGESLPSKQLKYSYFLPPDPHSWFRVDAEKLRRIVQHLIANAIKFTSGGHIFIDIDWQPLPNSVLKIVISDTGIGIEEKKMQRILQAFEQADFSAARQYSGAGIGLALCDRLLKLMGGSMEISSTPAKGTTVSCSVQISQSKQTQHQNPAPLKSFGRFKKVCIGELNEHWQTAIERIVQRSGLQLIAYPPARTTSQVLVISQHLSQLTPYQDSEAFCCQITDAQLPADNGHLQQFTPFCLPCPLDITALSTLLYTPRKATPQTASVHHSKNPDANFRVLVVEDNAVNARVINLMLKKARVSVDMAETGKLAIDRVATQSYNLVFMDCHMPQMDGFTATKYLREAGYLMPIIALTASDVRHQKKKFTQSGFSAALQKPLSYTALLACLKQNGFQPIITQAQA